MGLLDRLVMVFIYSHDLFQKKRICFQYKLKPVLIYQGTNQLLSSLASIINFLGKKFNKSAFIFPSNLSTIVALNSSQVFHQLNILSCILPIYCNKKKLMWNIIY